MTSIEERLVRQLVRAQEREGELGREREAWAGREGRREALAAHLALVLQQGQRVEGVRGSLAALTQAAQERYTQAIQEDEAARAQLAEELRVAIDAVNQYSEEVVQLEARTMHENKSLKEQLDIYAKYHATGQEKYQEIMKSREEEYAKIAAERDAKRERKPQLEMELEQETKALEESRKEHAVLQEQVNNWSNKFSEIQQRLLKARESFESARDKMERHMRRIRTLESDKQMLLKKAEKSKLERDKEHAKVMSLEEKISAQKKQTEKLLAVVAMLNGNTTDQTADEKTTV